MLYYIQIQNNTLSQHSFINNGVPYTGYTNNRSFDMYFIGRDPVSKDHIFATDRNGLYALKMGDIFVITDVMTTVNDYSNLPTSKGPYYIKFLVDRKGHIEYNVNCRILDPLINFDILQPIVSNNYTQLGNYYDSYNIFVDMTNTNTNFNTMTGSKLSVIANFNDNNGVVTPNTLTATLYSDSYGGEIVITGSPVIDGNNYDIIITITPGVNINALEDGTIIPITTKIVGGPNSTVKYITSYWVKS